HLDLPSFPTRRSSDLVSVLVLVLVATALVVVGSLTLLRRYLLGGLVLSALAPVVYVVAINYVTMNYCLSPFCVSGPVGVESVVQDRKSTRLNSSHLVI